ncbi:MAG TPA: TonB-dependent receptor [Melioribacteraceae bacterium]|nr:TonB-dependent receptor [Melioribacteraceae bacterium]
MKKGILLSVFSFFLAFNHLSAQSQDSIKSYRLEELTVQGVLVLEPESFIKIGPKEIKKSDAGTVIQLGRKIPSIKVQTNSRGESLFFFRGSGERQITLFLDGIPLNIPWDNRIDLSLIPAGVIGGITMLKGIPPSLFGANSISGVIEMSSVNPGLTDKNGTISAQLGETGDRSFAGTYMNRNEKLSYLISANYIDNNNYRLPSSFSDPSNPGRDRLNSFRESKNLFGKLNYKFSEKFNGGFFFSYIDSEKGVPPEIGVENPRYWRYPEWKNLIVGTMGNIQLDQVSSYLFYSLSYNKFDMEIDQFTDFTFNTYDDIEKNDDNTFRGRIIYTNILSENSLLKIGLNGQFFQHKEEFMSGNFVSQIYSENILSGGFEYEYIKDNYVLSLGGGIDRIETPKTGDKPAKESVTDFSVNAAFVYSITSNMSVRINGGRKTRFPTLRETFSGALGRFVTNPELKAEVATSGELSFSYLKSGFSTDASLFLSYLKDGIVRITLPQKQFMRVNKDEIRTYGIELISKYTGPDVQAYFNFTYLSASAKNASGEFADTLEYRPELMSTFGIDYSLTNRLSALLEFEYVGNEFGLREGTAGYQRLPDYFLSNFRIAYNFELGGSGLEVYFRINNLFDRLYYTQFGLPESGRQFFLGANFEF